MQTIEENDLVSAAFEACSGFSMTGDGSPVCTGCGWLEAEHETEAEVHALKPRRPARATQKRLAS
jgi:hypothetical protein